MKDNLKEAGIWGQRHYQYLKENRPTTINVMRMNGTLKSYLRDVNEQAGEMVFRLVKQFARQVGVTEELKRRDQMAWVGVMNNIRDRVNEIVLNELICIRETVGFCSAFSCKFTIFYEKSIDYLPTMCYTIIVSQFS